MRTIKIDEKWSFSCIDVNSEIQEAYTAAASYRYGDETQIDPNNLEVAMAQRIMGLEDAMEEFKNLMAIVNNCKDHPEVVYNHDLAIDRCNKIIEREGQ